MDNLKPWAPRPKDGLFPKQTPFLYSNEKVGLGASAVGDYEVAMTPAKEVPRPTTQVGAPVHAALPAGIAATAGRETVLVAAQRKMGNPSMRTSKVTKKGVLLPITGEEEEEIDAISDFYRVSAYSTSKSYQLVDLLVYLKEKESGCPTEPVIYDEVIYTPYSMKDTITHEIVEGDVFYFEYGVVVMWGFQKDQERRIVHDLQLFELDRLKPSEVETEHLLYYYDPQELPRIWNDVITLKGRKQRTKLTISHALAQSVKLAIFEARMERTINSVQHIPEELAKTGKVTMSRVEISKKIGELFVERMHVNLISNVLDTPDIFWAEPELEPLYQAIRTYMEISRRIEVLNQRCAVISDMLDMLKEHLNAWHGEKLEWIIIILIFLEMVVGVCMVMFEAIKL